MLILEKQQGLLASESWTPAQSDRTGKTGLVPTSCLYPIPTITKPSAQLLVSCPEPGYHGHVGGPRPGSSLRGPHPSSQRAVGPPGQQAHSATSLVVAILLAVSVLRWALTVTLETGAMLPPPPPRCAGNQLSFLKPQPHLNPDPGGPKSPGPQERPPGRAGGRADTHPHTHILSASRVPAVCSLWSVWARDGSWPMKQHRLSWEPQGGVCPVWGASWRERGCA